MKKIFLFLALITVGFILFVNNVSATIEIFTGLNAAIPEPLALLLFGSGLIGLANVGRKKVFTKEKDIGHLKARPVADS